MDVEAVERAVLERVARPPDAGERAVGEVVRVEDQRRALGHVGEIRLQCGGIHCDEDVRTVAGSEDVVVGEVHLEAADAGERALRSADLGGEVREGRQVVAEHGGFLGEPVTGELHAVAGVAGDADDDAIELLDVLGHRRLSCVIRV